jgi:hypothetical protein
MSYSGGSLFRKELQVWLFLKVMTRSVRVAEKRAGSVKSELEFVKKIPYRNHYGWDATFKYKERSAGENRSEKGSEERTVNGRYRAGYPDQLTNTSTWD